MITVIRKDYESMKRNYEAFKSAEKIFNKRKSKLSESFQLILRDCAISKDYKKFNMVSKDYIEILGESYSISINSIAILYGIESMVNLYITKTH